MGDAAETHKLFLEVEEEEEWCFYRSPAEGAQHPVSPNPLSKVDAGRQGSFLSRPSPSLRPPPEQPVQPSPHDVRKGNRLWLLFSGFLSLLQAWMVRSIVAS